MAGPGLALRVGKGAVAHFVKRSEDGKAYGKNNMYAQLVQYRSLSDPREGVGCR